MKQFLIFILCIVSVPIYSQTSISLNNLEISIIIDNKDGAKTMTVKRDYDFNLIVIKDISEYGTKLFVVLEEDESFQAYFRNYGGLTWYRLDGELNIIETITPYRDLETYLNSAEEVEVSGEIKNLLETEKIIQAHFFSGPFMVTKYGLVRME